MTEPLAEPKRCRGRCGRTLTLDAFLRVDGTTYSDYCGDCARWSSYARYGGGVAQIVKVALKAAGLPLTAWAPKWLPPDQRDLYYLGYWHATAVHARTLGKRTLARNIWRTLWEKLAPYEYKDPTGKEEEDA